MRIRYLLLMLFGVLALAPVAVFGLWSSSNVLDNEFRAVQDKHSLLAHNLRTALDRYHLDLVAVLNLLSFNLAAGHPAANSVQLLADLKVENLCIIDAASGVVLRSAESTLEPCPHSFQAEALSAFLAVASEATVSFTGVMADAKGDNVIYAVEGFGDKLSVAAVSTKYFVQLGESIAFGIRGHAAIVDQYGNVLAHPLKDWVASRKNIAGLSIVKRMMAGESGIEQFYSPAIEADMIAGFTSVPGIGWGVMIPQPVEELYQKAGTSQATAFAILLGSLVVAALLSVLISFRLSRPIEKLIGAIEAAGANRPLEEIAVDRSVVMPRELVKLQDAYNEMVVAMRRGQSRIRRLAYTDSVTALPNRESFQMLATSQIIELAKAGGEGAMIFIDVDEFKFINDTLGHDRGDQVLRALADRLTYAVQKSTGMKPLNRHPEEEFIGPDCLNSPVIGRVGGDEFLVFIPNPGKSWRLERVLKHIQSELGRPLPDFGGERASVEITGGASVGVACYPEHGKDYDTLVKLADIAMYHAKHNGKNRCEVFRSEIGDVTAAEMRVDVSRGLKAGEFVLCYQPKICSRTGKVRSVEALIRWHNRSRNALLLPDIFIPLIEDSDVIIEVGEWVLKEATKQIAVWEDSGLTLNVAVNIASRHFVTAGFARRAREIVLGAGGDPSRIEIEITEETVLASIENAREITTELQGYGFSVSLDDFGRGYSNLSRLANLAVQTIKIDAPLTAGITHDARTRVIVASTIEMAHGLGCTIVAEGVETLEQAMILRQLGCEELQGFYFAEAMEGGVLAAWLGDRRSNQVRRLQGRLSQVEFKRRRHA